MKVTLICLFLLFCFVWLFANPTYYMAFSEVWFDENNHLMVEFQPGCQWLDSHDNLVVCNTQLGCAFGFVFTGIPSDSMVVLDFTERYPILNFNQQNDILILGIFVEEDILIIDEVSWGDSLLHDIYPPEPGQSVVQSTNNLWEPEGSPFSWYIGEMSTPGTPNTIAISTITVHVTDQNNIPVTNLPLYYTSYSPPPVIPIGYTDDNGFFSINKSAGKYRIVVRHPETNDVIYNNTFWLYPDETTELDVQLTLTGNTDEVQPFIKTGLHAYPVPYSQNTSTTITFVYDGEKHLDRESNIRLYDTKGRFVTQIPFVIKGTTNWTPPPWLASGEYLARLISGNRFVDTASLSIIK
jgi:hypothetical protein